MHKERDTQEFFFYLQSTHAGFGFLKMLLGKYWPK